MAAAEVRRQLRAATRAWRKLLRRRIKPVTALRVFGRSCWKIIQLLSRLSLLVIGGSVVAVLMVLIRLVLKIRGAKAG